MDLIGQKLGRYEITDKIACGGMADVYRARQEKLDRDVAIKILPALLSRDETFRIRFEQEARAVAQLSHPNILTVFDYGEQEGLSYLVMEYAAGGTLKERMVGPLPVEKAIEITCQIGSALEYAHQRGLVHRDVKPGNVLLNEEGWPLLSDFGLVKMVTGSSNLTQSGVSIGTPEYMSPEQAQGLPVDHRSDIYSLGALLYEMVTGRAPYTADMPVAVILKHINEPLPSARELRPELPVEIEAVIGKAMAKVPEDRYATAAEMVSALRQAWQQSDANAESGTSKREAVPDLQPSSVPPGGLVPLRKRAAVWAAAVVLVLLTGGLGLTPMLAPGLVARVMPFWALPTSTIAPPPSTVAPTNTLPHRSPIPTSTETPVLSPSATLVSIPTRPFMPAPTATRELMPTWTPSPSATPTPGPHAVARLSSTVFEGPRTGTKELAIVAPGEAVEVLGRGDESKYGRWLYIRTSQGIQGFVYEPRFEHDADWESLVVQEVQDSVIVSSSAARLAVSAGPLRLEHVWPTGECKPGGGWTAVFEVKISGGDGRDYRIYWDQQEVSFTVKVAEHDVAIFRWPGMHGMIVGTVWVESGGVRVGEPTSAKAPERCP